MHEISRLEFFFFNLCGIRSENSQSVTHFLCKFVKKQQKKSFSPSPASKIMMLVAKATVLTQVAGPSYEMRPVIGLSTDRLQIKHFDWLAGWLAAAGAPADRDSGESIDSIGWQTVDTHTHTHTYRGIYTNAGELEVQGEIWPSGGHLCGSECMCV